MSKGTGSPGHGSPRAVKCKRSNGMGKAGSCSHSAPRAACLELLRRLLHARWVRALHVAHQRRNQLVPLNLWVGRVQMCRCTKGQRCSAGKCPDTAGPALLPKQPTLPGTPRQLAPRASPIQATCRRRVCTSAAPAPAAAARCSLPPRRQPPQQQGLQGNVEHHKADRGR